MFNRSLTRSNPEPIAADCPADGLREGPQGHVLEAPDHAFSAGRLCVDVQIRPTKCMLACCWARLGAMSGYRLVPDQPGRHGRDVSQLAPLSVRVRGVLLWGCSAWGLAWRDGQLGKSPKGCRELRLSVKSGPSLPHLADVLEA